LESDPHFSHLKGVINDLVQDSLIAGESFDAFGEERKQATNIRRGPPSVHALVQKQNQLGCFGFPE
jgi:hypothetical protein